MSLLPGRTGIDCKTGDYYPQSWESANNTYCPTLDWGGDGLQWRLPTIKELSGIVDTGKTEGVMINTAVFPETPLAPLKWFWSSSSSSDPNDLQKAWDVNFANGTVWEYDKSAAFHVRCVRAVAKP